MPEHWQNTKNWMKYSMDNKTILNVISNLISHIYSEEFEATIPALSECCNIPVEYTRKCLLQILQNKTLSACIDATDPEDPDPDHFIYNDFLTDRETVVKNLLSGKYDHCLWTMDLKILGPDEDQILSLNALEYSALLNSGETDISFKHGAICEHKDNITKVPKTVRENQERLQTAIDNRFSISFCYRDKDGNTKIHKGFPVNISTNVMDNWIYFELANEKTYRLDRVTSTVKIIKNPEEFPEIHINPKKKYMWGSFFNDAEEPVHIKIVITDTTTNLINKIKSDIHHREGLCQFYKSGSYYFYEDDIIGISEFQRWLRGYGSSIQVLEPASLRAKMIDSAKTTLANYEKAESWNEH